MAGMAGHAPRQGGEHRALAVGLGLALVLIDFVAWRIASAIFDRERLILGKSAT
jgi:hypothetical protein